MIEKVNNVEWQNIANPIGITNASDGKVECYFRYGYSYADITKDKRHSWVIDLYQRKVILTGKALACDLDVLPQTNQIVKVKGQIVNGNTGQFLWVQSMSAIQSLSTEVCAVDLATPAWVSNQFAADEFSKIWSSLSVGYRELINEILYDANILKLFLNVPGSINHHDVHTGGCLEHTIMVAKMADAICTLSTDLDRDLLVAGAILHDIGKSTEYEQNNYGRWRMSEIGRKIGHKVGGALLISNAANKCRLISSSNIADLLHIITSSYAPTWAGYRSPSIPEAFALSAIDRICAKKVSAQ